MLLRIFENRIQRAFSNAALQYDMLTTLHKDIGRDLVKRVCDREEAACVLDVGMGTGYLTEKLKSYFPDSQVIGLDFSSGMIAQARKRESDFKIIQADAARLPFCRNAFDIIVSNLALQWVEPLPETLRKFYDALRPGGDFVVSVFGRETFPELFSAFKQARGKDLPLKRLPSKEEIVAAVRAAGFENVVMDYETIKVRFEDMRALLRWVKDIGANGLKKDFFVGPDLLDRAAEIYDRQYRDRFGVFSTLEIVWLQAKRNK